MFTICNTNEVDCLMQVADLADFLIMTGFDMHANPNGLSNGEDEGPGVAMNFFNQACARIGVSILSLQ